MEKKSQSLSEIKQLAREYNIIPIYREILADMETPVSTFLKISRNMSVAFLLESVEGGEKVARYSFIGIDPFLRFRANGMRYQISGIIEESGDGHPVERLKKLIGEFKPYHPPDLPRLSCGAVGYFSYDTIRLFENIPDKNPKDVDVDEIDFGFYRTLLVFDNRRHRLILITNIMTNMPGQLDSKYQAAEDELGRMEKVIRAPVHEYFPSSCVPPKSQPPVSNFKKEEYLKKVEKIKDYIRAGDAFQVVLSQRFTATSAIPPFDIYRCLRLINPSPYMFFFKLDDTFIIGSSPEMLVRVENGWIETRPLAGTRPRGKTEDEDERLAKELLADEKERAEHIMLVDLGRNDLGRVSVKGTVAPEEMMRIERYSHVMHIVSSVKGKLRPDMSAIDALFACFPAGTLSGAPKIRAMEIIDEFEPVRRGIYGGALGYIDFSGNLDTCIVIRTIVMRNNKVIIQSGGGLVADSIPENEYNESCNKAKAMFRAIEMAEELHNEL